MARRAHARVFAALVILLIGAHVFAPSRAADRLWLGWIPFDLGYHLLWMAAAAGVVLYLTERVWPEVP